MWSCKDSFLQTVSLLDTEDPLLRIHLQAGKENMTRDT